MRWRISDEGEFSCEREFAVKLQTLKPGKVLRFELPTGEAFCMMNEDDFNHVLSLAQVSLVTKS